MAEFVTTADLYDQHGEALDSCDTQLRQYGARSRFSGEIVTVACFEDNVLLKRLVSAPGHGKVVVVDGGGSLHRALLGDKLAELAASNGWEGLVIHGAVRDARALGAMDIGVKALGTNPRKCHKDGGGTTGGPVAFGGATFNPGATLVSDEDGIVVVSS